MSFDDFTEDAKTIDAVVRFHDDAIVFEEDHLRFDNIKFEKVGDPVTEVLKKCSERPELLEWVVNDVVDNLRYLERYEDAEKVLQLKQQ